MGTVNTIKHDKFPKQGHWLFKRVKVCFHYDTSHYLFGTIIRDDAEEPGVCIIRLDNGNTILTTECQYSPI